MVNKSKIKGTAYETETVNRLRERGHEAERIALAGGDDEGDVHVYIKHGSNIVSRAIIECKNVKQINLSAFVDQAITERDTYCKKRGLDPSEVDAVAFVKRRNHGWEKGYAVTTVDQWLKQKESTK